MPNLKILALCGVVLMLVNCGGAYFIGFVSNPGGTTTITGTVTSADTGFASGPGGPTSVTVVTFADSEVSTTIYFCGEHQALFPLHQVVRAEFTAGVICSVLVQVAIIAQAS